MAIDFDDSQTQGPDTVIVQRSFSYDASDGQKGEACPTFNPSVLQFSKSQSNGQTQYIETTTDLAQNDSSKQISESNKDIGTACESMTQPSSRQSDTYSTL